MESGKGVRWRKLNRESWPAVGIISALDVFLVILILGLKTFAPAAQVQAPAAEGARVEIGPNGVQVEGRLVAKLRNFEAESSEAVQSPELQAGLDRALASVRTRGPLTIQADSRAPYHMIQTVVATAASHGLKSYRLVVVREEQ